MNTTIEYNTSIIGGPTAVQDINALNVKVILKSF
jgi:hypothetical protein